MSFNKISIIIPVYNSEKYINKCLESLFNQTDYSFETIIIDDGSTDASNLIIKNYIKKNTSELKIELIEQKNSGVSVARNEGLTLARGEYILFLDSDDFLENNAIEKINKILSLEKNLDLILFRYNKAINGEYIKELNRYDEVILHLNKKEFIEKVNDSKINFWIGATIFKRSDLLKNGIFFSENKSYGEDLELMYKYLFSCKNIFYSNIILSNYNVRENSLTTNYNIDQLDSVNLLLALYKEYSHLNSKEFNDLFYQNTISNNLLYNIRNLRPIYSFFNLISFIQKNSEIKKYIKKLNTYNKTKLIYYLTKK